MKGYKQKNQLLIVFLVVGFFIGIVYENLISRSQGMTIEIFRIYFLDQYAQTEIVAEEYLWYITKVRSLPFIMLCILGYLRWKKVLAAVWLAWTGFLAGMLTVSAVMQLGIKGILFCIVGMMPHMLCYGAAYAILLLYLYQYPEKSWNGAKTVFVILMWFLGIALETYLNPFVIKMLVRIL